MGFLKLFPKRASQYEGENAALVQAIHALALADKPENRKKMYEILLASILLIPTPELPARSNQHNDAELALHWITDKQGRKLTPVFTDIEALRNWDPNTPVLACQARNFFTFLVTNYPAIQGVVINPFDPIRNMIRPMAIIASGEFEVLARGGIPKDEGLGLFSQNEPDNLGVQSANQTLPPAIAEVLSSSARGFPEIANIYVFSIILQGLPPQLSVGLSLDTAVTKEREQFIVKALWGAVAAELLKQTEVKSPLGFVVLTGKIATQVEHLGAKIYQRC